jgi:hypothetical protein
MLKQLDPATVLTKFQALADAGKQIVATSLPSDQIGTMLDLAMKGKSLPMSSVSFTPPLIKPVLPDFAKIRQLVTDSIAASQAKDKAAANPQAAPASSAPASSTPPSTTAPASSPSSSKGTKTDTENLDSICKVS